MLSVHTYGIVILLITSNSHTTHNVFVPNAALEGTNCLICLHIQLRMHNTYPVVAFLQAA